jgi:hypothetical protein
MAEAQVKRRKSETEEMVTKCEFSVPDLDDTEGDEIIFLGGVTLSNKDLLAFVEHTVATCCHLVSKLTGKSLPVKDFVPTAKQVDPDKMRLFFVSDGECAGPNFKYRGKYLFIKNDWHSLVLPSLGDEKNEAFQPLKTSGPVGLAASDNQCVEDLEPSHGISPAADFPPELDILSSFEDGKNEKVPTMELLSSGNQCVEDLEPVSSISPAANFHPDGEDELESDQVAGSESEAQSESDSSQDPVVPPVEKNCLQKRAQKAPKRYESDDEILPQVEKKCLPRRSRKSPKHYESSADEDDLELDKEESENESEMEAEVDSELDPDYVPSPLQSRQMNSQQNSDMESNDVDSDEQLPEIYDLEEAELDEDLLLPPTDSTASQDKNLAEHLYDSPQKVIHKDSSSVKWEKKVTNLQSENESGVQKSQSENESGPAGGFLGAMMVALSKKETAQLSYKNWTPVVDPLDAAVRERENVALKNAETDPDCMINTETFSLPPHKKDNINPVNNATKNSESAELNVTNSDPSVGCVIEEVVERDTSMSDVETELDVPGVEAETEIEVQNMQLEEREREVESNIRNTLGYKKGLCMGPKSYVMKFDPGTTRKSSDGVFVSAEDSLGNEAPPGGRHVDNANMQPVVFIEKISVDIGSRSVKVLKRKSYGIDCDAPGEKQHKLCNEYDIVPVQKRRTNSEPAPAEKVKRKSIFQNYEFPIGMSSCGRTIRKPNRFVPSLLTDRKSRRLDLTSSEKQTTCLNEKTSSDEEDHNTPCKEEEEDVELIMQNTREFEMAVKMSQIGTETICLNYIKNPEKLLPNVLSSVEISGLAPPALDCLKDHGVHSVQCSATPCISSSGHFMAL